GLKALEAGDTMKLRANRVLNVDDVFNRMAPGLGIEALFKAASAVWSAALAGVAGGNAMGIAVARK
ncbi:hypothetical protein Tco_0574811, partial [Tanacetum coccineum]